MIAIMQPYLFPYLGYFQLIHAVDTFVLYDDVNYIKKGYINRNNILNQGEPLRITIPVLDVSQNKKINEHYFSTDVQKILKTIQTAYFKAPYFNQVYPMIEAVLLQNDRKVSNVCYAAIQEILTYLGLKREVLLSSQLDYDRDLPAADKLMDITKLLGHKEYVNSIGGQSLYDTKYFNENDINLLFIKMQSVIYKQNCCDFVPNLSIIDILMWNDISKINTLLQSYDFFR